jgi:O-antigen ligase
MFNQDFHRKTYIVLFYLLLFFLPNYRFIIPYIISLIILNWLVEGRFRKKIQYLNSSVDRRKKLSFASLYLIYLIGLLYTTNFNGLEGGLFDVQVKLSIVVFPLIFSTLPPGTLKKISRTSLSRFYLAGCLTAMMICFVLALIKHLNTGSKHEFYYTFISIFLHPSYFSMYLNLAIVITLYYIFLDKSKSLKINSALLILFLLALVIFNILLSSKAGFIGMILIFSLFLIYMVFWKKMFLISTIFGVAAFITIYFFSIILPYNTMRMNTVKVVVKAEPPTEPTEGESSMERLIVWQSGWEIIKKNFVFGIGTGDVRNELVKKYREKGYTYAMDLRLNAHSQFIETFIALGLFGLIVLLLNIFIPMFFAFKNQDHIYFFFLILIAFNFLFESMLQTQAGTVFYGFVNVLLFSTGWNHKEIDEEKIQ